MVSHNGSPNQSAYVPSLRSVADESGTRRVMRAVVPMIAPSPQRTRVMSTLALMGVMVCVGLLARAVYRAATDALVAPIVLSPESDLVIPSKLNLARLTAERDALQAQMLPTESELNADASAMRRLHALKQLVSRSLEWSDVVTARSRSSSSGDLRTLGEERQLIARDIVDQQKYVKELEASLRAGLIHRADLVRERSELTRMRMAALQLERERRASESQLHQSRLAQDALHPAAGGSVVQTPEMVQQREHYVKIELDILKLDTEMRAKQEQLQHDRAQLDKLDGLIVQVKDRPLFRAIDAEQNVAFVPYTQLSGVKRGSKVYQCHVFGLFYCEYVGHVRELLAGEVTAQDPWGSPARGQYALLTLNQSAAARAKVLHVR